MKFFSRNKKPKQQQQQQTSSNERSSLLMTPTKFRKSPSEILNDVISKASTEDSSPPSVLKIDSKEGKFADDVSELNGSVTDSAARRLFSPSSELQEQQQQQPQSSSNPSDPEQPQEHSNAEKALDKFLVIPETDEPSIMEHSTNMNKRIKQALEKPDDGRPPLSPPLSRDTKKPIRYEMTDDQSPRGVSELPPMTLPSSPNRQKKRSGASNSPKRSAVSVNSFEPNRTSSVLSVSMLTAYSGNTDATTLPATNLTRECNPLNPILYLSLIMPIKYKQDRIEAGRDTPDAEADVSNMEDFSTPREVILRSLERNLNYLILNGDRSPTSDTTPTSVPVSVDDNTLQLSYYENTLGVVDSVAQAHVLQHDYGAAFDVYLSLYSDMAKNRKELGQKDRQDKKTARADLSIRKSLLNRLTIASFLAGSKNRCVVFAKEAMRLASKGSTKNALIAFLQLGLVQLGLGEYDKVIVSWREAIYKAGYNIENAALIWNNLATLRYYSDELPGARTALLESLALQKQVRSRDPKVMRRSLLNMAITLSNLAVVTTRSEQYASALAYLEESLLIQESVFEEGSKEIATTTKLIKELEQVVMLFGEEDSIMVTGIDPSREICHWSDSDGLPLLRASTMSSSLDFISLGSLLHELGPYQRIRDVLMKNFPFYTQLKDRVLENACQGSPRKSMPVDLDDSSLLNAEHNLEQIYEQATQALEKNDIEEVLELLKGALRDHRQKYGTMHPLVGSTLHNLGMTMLYAGKYNQSLAYFQHAVDVRSTTLGSEHPETNSSLIKIGMIQASKADYQNALATFSQVLRGRRKAQGYNHVEAAKALNNIACVDYECGGLVSAQKSLEEAIDILEKNAFSNSNSGSLDEETIDRGLAAVISNMGFLKYKRGRPEEAKTCYEKVAVLQGKWDPDAVPMTLENIVYLNEEMNRSSPRSMVSSGDKSKNTSMCSSGTEGSDSSSLAPLTAPSGVVNTRLEDAFEFISEISLMKLAGCA